MRSLALACTLTLLAASSAFLPACGGGGDSQTPSESGPVQISVPHTSAEPVADGAQLSDPPLGVTNWQPLVCTGENCR